MRCSLVAILCCFQLVTAVTLADDGGTESPFSFGAGARDIALGGSAISYAGPATAVFWNPAALAEVQRLSLGTFHSRLYDSDAAYQYVGLAIPTIDFGSFGLGVFRLGIDGIEKRDNNNLLLGEFSDNRLAFYFGYGRLVSSYDVGLAFTMEHHSLDEYSATSSPGLNLALSRRFQPKPQWIPEVSVSICGHNLIKPSLKLDEETVNYPITAVGALSATIMPKPQRHHAITFFVKVIKVDGVDPRISGGLEYDLERLLFVRGGVRDNKLSFGAGLRYRNFCLDYTLANRDLGGLHMFSISVDFGASVSEKKLLRAQKQEKQFHELMDQRLANHNEEMVSQLVERGKEFTEAGKLGKANTMFDRALFLARNNGVDTTTIHRLASESRSRLQEITLKQEYVFCMDSAQSKLDSDDYLGARYFTGMALSKLPEAQEAKRLLKEIDSKIAEGASKEQMIEDHILLADSLLSYGRIEEALVTLEAVAQVAASDSRVQQRLNKAAFEYHRQEAINAFSHDDYSAAAVAIDSALLHFPEHPWCLKLQNEIRKELSHSPTIATTTVESEPLSVELRKEVDHSYQKGQEFFERGELSEAISQWEKVEQLAPGFAKVREYLVKAYRFVGVELYSQNQLQEALTTWRKAQQLAPDNAEIDNYIKRTENEISKLQELSYESQ